MKDNKEIEEILTAIKEDPYKIEHVDESLYKDREFVLAACKAAEATKEGCMDAWFPGGDYDEWGFPLLQYVDESLRKDREIVLAAVKQNGFKIDGFL